MTGSVKRVTVDARLSDSLDGLILRPRDPSEALSVLSALRRTFPGISIRRSAHGITVGGFEAYKLFDDESAIDLHASTEVLRFAKNRRHAQLTHKTLLGQIREILAGDRNLSLRLLRGTRGLSTLDDHQVVNVAAMTLRGSFGLCLFDEQGAGKTVTLIFTFDVLVARDEVDFVLIIAPKSMVPEWPRDFERFKGDLYRVEIASGSRQDKIKAMAARADVLVTNFETATSMEGELRAIFRRHNGRAMLVVDESFYVKNLDAQRTRAIRRLREWCDRAYVLCGTPSPNSPHDVIQQFNTVDFGLTFEGVTIPDLPQEAHNTIQRAVENKGLFVRHLKRDVLPDLPGRQYERLLLPLQPNQEHIYRRALHDLVVDVKSTNERNFQRHLAGFLARRTALLQICSNPSAITESYSETPCKLAALDSLLSDFIGQKREKVIVWSFYTKSIDAIVKRYRIYNPVRYDGTVSDVTARRQAVQRFQEDTETMLFVANPAAAGAGLTLHRSRIAIYESFSNQAAHYLQSLDRIHRRGQSRDVKYLLLLCDQTIELQEYERLLTKQRSSQKLLGDPFEEQIPREVFLTEMTEAARYLDLKI